jgi:hypothetical protein
VIVAVFVRDHFVVVVVRVGAVVVVVLFGLVDVVAVDAGAENDELGLAGATEEGLAGSILTAVDA